MPRKGRTWRKRQIFGGSPCQLLPTSQTSDKDDTEASVPNLTAKQTFQKRPQSLQHEESFILLLRWMKKNGFSSKNLKSAAFSGTGRGLMTKTRLCSGDKIISVPSKILITAKTALNSYVGKSLEIIGNGADIVTPLQVLCLFLVYEKFKGGQSFWHPYISSLPESFSTPAFFTDQEFECLPGFLREKADIQLNSIKVSYELVRVLGKHIETSCKDLAGGLSWDQYLWAWGVVNTRSVFMEQSPHPLLTGDDHYALAPLLDMLNHAAFAKVKAEFTKSTDCYTIQTFDTYQPYEQVFICYGPHDNARLLLEYGFVLPKNPHNVVNFQEADFNVLQALFSHSEWKKKWSLIAENDVLSSLCCSYDGPSWNLQCLFRLLVRDWETRISCGEYLMTEPREDEKFRMKRMFDMVLKEKLQTFQECRCNIKECQTSYHITMIETLVSQLEEILIKRNLKRVTFDTG